jgi:hypothetical protein
VYNAAVFEVKKEIPGTVVHVFEIKRNVGPTAWA